MSSVLVTGAGGFIGGHLVEHLRAAGETVTATSRDGRLGRAVDLTDAGAAAALLRAVRPASIIHLAARIAGEPAAIVAANVTATAFLLEALRTECPSAALVLAGSAAEYGPRSPAELPVRESDACRPVGLHGVTKHAATLLALEYARTFDLNIAVARLFNVIGPHQPGFTVLGTVLAQTRDSLDSGRPAHVRVGRLDAIRDFVTVSDTVGALASLRGYGRGGAVVNICSGVPRTVASVAQRFAELGPVPVRLEIEARDAHAGEPAAMVGSWQKAHQLFGFTPSSDLDPVMREMWKAVAS